MWGIFDFTNYYDNLILTYISRHTSLQLLYIGIPVGSSSKTQYIRHYIHSCYQTCQYGPFHWRFFHPNSDSFCCNTNSVHTIDKIFYPCHNNICVMTCTKFCTDRIDRIWMRGKRNCRRLKIASEMGPSNVQTSLWRSSRGVWLYRLRGILGLFVWSLDQLLPDLNDVNHWMNATLNRMVFYPFQYCSVYVADKSQFVLLHIFLE